MHLWSFEGLKDSVQSFEELKDHTWNPSKGWRITCNPSTLRRISNAILQNWRTSLTMLQRFEGLHSQCFEWFKDSMESFVGLKKYSPFSILWRAWWFYLIFRRIEGLHFQSFNPLKDWQCDPLTLEGLNAILQRVEGSHVRSHVILIMVEGLKSFCDPLKGWRITWIPSKG